jgi:hypothetical protein
MAEQKYPKSCDIHVRFGASGMVNIKMIKSAYMVYEGISESGKYHHFQRDQILTPEQVAAEVADCEARPLEVDKIRPREVGIKSGMTDFTSSLLEKAAAEKIKADMLKEQNASAPSGRAHVKSEAKSKEDKHKPVEYQEGQVSCL